MKAHDMGATPGELASRPELLIDLALSLLPRRVSLAHGVLALLDGLAKEKVRTLLDEVQNWAGRLAGLTAFDPLDSRADVARETMWAVARLENAVWTLCLARIKCGMRMVPTHGIEQGV